MQTERELWHRECDATIAAREQTISELRDSARFLTDGIDELIRERDAHERKRDVAEARLAALTAERDEARLVLRSILLDDWPTDLHLADVARRVDHEVTELRQALDALIAAVRLYDKDVLVPESIKQAALDAARAE